MNKRAGALLLFLPALLAACAFGYQARGSLSDVSGEMRGKAYPGNQGGGRFVLSDKMGDLTCDAALSPPRHTPDAARCAGEEGEGVARCSDGRSIALRWQAITCRAVQGSGEDERGNRLVFRVERSVIKPR